jgi:isocitrate/isopropylmalate dehydrogenase
LPVRPPLTEDTSAHVSIRQHTSAYVRIRQHTSAYVSIRQHTSAKRHTPEREGNDNVVVNRDRGCNEHLAVDRIRIVPS